MAGKGQSSRLTAQHILSEGVTGIFGEIAKRHDLNVFEVSKLVTGQLESEYPQLEFRHRKKVTKVEINEALQRVDPELGQTLFVPSASVIPDGGLIEVKDDDGDWRVVAISEAKYQGKDLQNIRAGILVGKKKDQDLMAAGNAIERSHKNIAEMANFMLSESHFPYVLFLEGTNFLTQTLTVARPDGRTVILNHDSGMLNRLDRLTAANFGQPINMNLCENKVVASNGNTFMLQSASIFTQGDGEEWDSEEMFTILLDVAKTSLRVLASDLFNQLSVVGGEQ
ncbi:EcoRI family type II restriction endonuclease [uncultured Lawsonella sp.]|uniref:EcoRI family type II restriction endonuclease n=1 Tax=uncultured Lawsonella sp. TaxID=1847727 RepID=UPI00345C910D